MAKEILRNCGIWIGGHNVRGSFNTLNLEGDTDLREATCFGDETRVYLPGFRGARWSLAGYYQDTVDAAMDALHGVADTPFTLSKDITAGSVAYVGRGIINQVSRAAQTGDVYQLTVAGQLSGSGFGRGAIVLPATTITTSGASTGQQLGAVPSGGRVRAALHVVSVSGTSPTLDVVVESDTANTFGSPIEMAAFAEVSAVGAQFVDVTPQNNTDTWWRVSWTVGGTSPSFVAVVSVAVA